MSMASTQRCTAHCVGIALITASMATQGAVGARVLLQEWSPLNPTQQPLRVLVDDPAIISTQMQKAWTGARPSICKAVVAAMAQTVASKGQQLRDVKCLLDAAPAFSVAGAGANALSAALAVGGYVEATTTVPGPTGSSLDPRFSLAITAHVRLALTVQPRPDQILRVEQLTFALANANIDSHNATGDVIKFVAEDLLDAFKGTNFKKIAEDAINGQSIDLAKTFNAELAPVNALLAGPSTAVRIAVWGRPDLIVVAFGPRELTPPGGGSVFGALRWDKSKVAAVPGDCSGFTIDATVQTGPAPLRDPGGYFEPGDAPKRKIGGFQRQASTNDSECRYRMTALAAGWPHRFKAHSSIGAKKATGSALYRVSQSLSGDGWDGHNVVPQPSAERNYLVHGAISASATQDLGSATERRLRSPGEPVMNPTATTATALPATLLSSPSTLKKGVGTQAAAPSPSALPAAATRVDAMSFNPQRLPPKATTAPAALTQTTNKVDAVALNPQPLPPAALPAQVPSALR